MNNFQYLASASKIKGRHAFKSGFDIRHLQHTNDSDFSAQYHFSTLPTADPQNVGTTGSALASYLLGLPSDGRHFLGDLRVYPRATNYQFYLQDDIKASNKLTLNLGLRYEYNQWPYEKYNRLAFFDTISGQFVWAGDNPVLGVGPNIRRNLIDPDWNNFAPRLGIAYQMNSKTTVRSSYGVFYASNNLWEALQTHSQWPYGIAELLTGQNIDFPTSPIETLLPANTTVGPGTPPSAAGSVGRTDRTPYMQQWSFGVQRELARDLLLEVDYVGNHGVKMPLFSRTNDPPPGPGVPGSPQHPRPFPQVGSLGQTGNLASSSYNALQVKTEKRFSQGLQFLLSYTWGHYIDIGGAGYAHTAQPQDERNIKADRAAGDLDRRHIFSASYFYELPFGRGKRFLATENGLANQIVGGWEVTGITSYHTASPVTVIIPFDNANTGSFAPQRPDRVAGQSARVVSVMSQDKTQGWLNPAAFKVSAPFTFGNLGRNTERGPGFGNWDLGLFKNFPLSHEGKQTLQFRAEFFNAWNNVNLDNPGGEPFFGIPFQVLGSPSFGRIFSTANPSREIQFALKFLF